MLTRVLDLVETWQKDSPYTKSIKLVISDPMLKSISPCRIDQSNSNNMIPYSPICNRYINDVNNVCKGNDAIVSNQRSPHIHSSSSKEHLILEKNSQLSGLRIHSKSLIED